MQERHEQRVVAIQEALRDQALDGWLFYDFRGSDPLAYRILHLDPSAHVTRRWYYWVPAVGEPMKLLHRIEPHVLDDLPGQTNLYVGWREQHDKLRSILRQVRRLVMQYSPMNEIPYLSRLDAGTAELIRSFGIELLTAADLVQRFEATWTDAQVASHRAAAENLRAIVDESFGHLGERVRAGPGLTEYELQRFVLSRMQVRGLTTSHPPIVAADGHSADPHYGPSAERSSPIMKGSFVLIDLWAKQREAGAVYADITWTGFVGETVPHRHEEVFQIVRAARDAAVSFVRSRAATADLPCGWEVDDVCRDVIRQAGYGDQFLHRTGHSIGEEVHGNGANIDNLETRDGRRLLRGTCFSIEPGIYLTGEFGVRSELDVYLSDDVEIFGQPIQTHVVPILR